MTTRYDPHFFEAIRADARRSASIVVPLVVELLAPRSVVDVGCGDGTWLSVFRDNGVEDYLGLDGDYVDLAHLAIPRDRFAATELRDPLTLARTFDLAVCLEVGEHLDPDHADVLVASLVSAAPAVLFSAAVPFQTGEHHVNEQWPEYWADRFARHGYTTVDALRDRIWDDPQVAWWYAQNALIYADAATLARRPALRAIADRTDPNHLTRVHPRNYARIGELLAEKEKRRNRLSRRIGRLFRGRRSR
jgi:SAM-dependent methyltransferase